MTDNAVGSPTDRALAPEPELRPDRDDGIGSSPRSKAPLGGRLGIACVFFVAILTAAVTSYRVGHRQLWGDEYATWDASTLDLSDFERLISHVDRFLAPYYVFMHGWISVFGDSPTSLRAPNIIAMSVTAGLVVVLGRRLFNLETAVVAGLTFAAIPTVSRYAQEARPYGLATMLAVLATVLLVRAIDSPTWPRWLYYALAMVALGYTHIVAITLAAPHFIVIMAAIKRRDDRRMWRSLVACAAIALFVLPYVAWDSAQSSAADWIEVDASTLRQFPGRFIGSNKIAVLLAVLAVAAVILLWRRAKLGILLLTTWAILPPAIAFVGGESLHFFLFRYFLFTLPAWCLLAAAGVTALSRAIVRSIGRQESAFRVVGGAALVVCVALLSLPTQRLYRLDPLQGTFPDYRGLATTMIAQERPGDGIAYAGSASSRRALSYEMRDAPKPRDVFLAKTPAQLGLYVGRECAVPASCIGAPPRIWLVSTVNASDPFAGMKPATAKLLQARFSVQRVQKFVGLHLILLVAKAG